MTLSDVSIVVLIVAVVASVGYLAVQLRQNTRALRSVLFQSASSPHSNYLGILAQDNDLARVFRTGAADYHTLRSEDQLQFWALGQMILNEFESGYFLQREGALPATSAERSRRMLRWWFAHPGFVQFWDGEKHILSDEFVRFVETSALDRHPRV